MSKKVSIIMLTFNGETYLREAIDSCLNQTYANTEVNIIDDCSADGTIEILKSYGDKISVIYNEINQGSTVNINKLGLSVKSDFIVFLGHDDKLPPDHVEQMLSEFDNDTVIVHCGSIIIDGKGKEFEAKKADEIEFKKANNSMFELSIDNFINAIGSMHRTETFQKVNGWDDEYKHYGEWTLYIKLLELGKLKYTNKTKSYYRVHATNISKTLSQSNMKNSLAEFKSQARYKAHILNNNSFIENIKFYLNEIKIFIKSCR